MSYLAAYMRRPSRAMMRGTAVKSLGCGRVEEPHSGPNRIPTCDTNRRTPWQKPCTSSGSSCEHRNSLLSYYGIYSM